MNGDRPIEFGIEMAEDTVLAAPIALLGHEYIGVAIDVAADLDEGSYRIALTEAEARDLHAALGAALADAKFPIKS